MTSVSVSMFNYMLDVYSFNAKITKTIKVNSIITLERSIFLSTINIKSKRGEH